jgi:hypothetical protein
VALGEDVDVEASLAELAEQSQGFSARELEKLLVALQVGAGRREWGCYLIWCGRMLGMVVLVA